MKNKKKYMYVITFHTQDMDKIASLSEELKRLTRPPPKFKGVSEKFPVRVYQPVPPQEDFLRNINRVNEDVCKLEGTIHRRGGGYNPSTNQPYFGFELKFPKEGKEWVFHSMNDFAESLLGLPGKGAEGWFYLQIQIHGKWYRADQVSVRIFGICVSPTTGGDWCEIHGMWPDSEPQGNFQPYNPFPGERFF